VRKKPLDLPLEFFAVHLREPRKCAAWSTVATYGSFESVRNALTQLKRQPYRKYHYDAETKKNVLVEEKPVVQGVYYVTARGVEDYSARLGIKPT
jgi:hypothetical protein